MKMKIINSKMDENDKTNYLGQGYCLLFASKQNDLVWLSTKERSQHVPLCGRYLAWLQLKPLEIIV